MLQVCQRIYFCFSTAHKYAIKDLKYLIEVPPKRPSNSFAQYIQEKSQGIIGVSATKNLSELSIVWKHLPAVAKLPYENKYKTEKEAFDKVKAQYDAKYVIPFKRVNSTALFVKHLYQDKLVTVQENAKIQDYANKVKELSQKKTPEQITKYNEQAKKIKEERDKKLVAFTFPQRKYKSQTGFTRSHPNVKEEEKKKLYKQYQESWKLEVKKWLEDNKVALTLEQFLKLYKRQTNLKRKAQKVKRDENDSEWSSESSQDLKRKRGARRVASSKPVKRVQAKAKKSSK